jgi:predicted anti-sigma-YlaC factor YlaD
MECHIFKMLIQRYHDGELDAVERAAYENHRGMCKSCRQQDAELARIFGALGNIELFEPSNAFGAKVIAQIDIARYRVSPARKAVRAFGQVWYRLPAQVRVGGALAVVFALFITAYRPFLDFFVSLGGRAITYLGTGLLVIQKVVTDTETVSKYLSSSTNYKVAGEILLKTFQRVIVGIPLYQILIVATLLIVVLAITFRAARIAWRKGETHVGIF